MQQFISSIFDARDFKKMVTDWYLSSSDTNFN